MVPFFSPLQRGPLKVFFFSHPTGVKKVIRGLPPCARAFSFAPLPSIFRDPPPFSAPSLFWRDVIRSTVILREHLQQLFLLFLVFFPPTFSPPGLFCQACSTPGTRNWDLNFSAVGLFSFPLFPSFPPPFGVVFCFSPLPLFLLPRKGNSLFFHSYFYLFALSPAPPPLRFPLRKLVTGARVVASG